MDNQVRMQDRRHAVKRVLNGEGAEAVSMSMGYSPRWIYKWLHRFESGAEDWYAERSRRPFTNPGSCPERVEAQVLAVRKRLEASGVFSGAEAIRWELEDLDLAPMPSIRTINRILSRHQMTKRRHGPYVPKGKKYPALSAQGPGSAHQSDFVGPCYLDRGQFYSLNTVDVATGRCSIEPLISRGGQNAIDAVWAGWCRLGIPVDQQVDNDPIFYGSPTHPRGMGMLIRLCLLNGAEVWFIPPGEPWRNGVVEKFNHHWRQKFYRRGSLRSEAELRAQSLAFEQRHNARYRYSKLSGKTPLAALKASRAELRFPLTDQAPRHPLGKPERGRYHLVRFVRGDGVFNVFSECFKAPPESHYEYVRLTVDVHQQRLLVFLGREQIDEHDYALR